jgi:hypothetical protein
VGESFADGNISILDTGFELNKAGKAEAVAEDGGNEEK